MKKTINTLQDALSYELQGMLYTEDKVRTEFGACSHHIKSDEILQVIRTYLDNSENVKLKIERVFNYLLVEPVHRKNEVVNKMIEETQHLLKFSTSPHLRHTLMIACIRNINTYKISSFATSYLMAIELEMDKAADLIQQVLEWESNTGKALSTLALHEFNNIEFHSPSN